ncbi:NAD-dependent epimerase/dehydratase family protein [Ensifer sp. LC163]|uniref:NAD-dependent epimerase/dehydratase family protein n=1 Tax=Ensifer sp. LC163 TaxID=1120652 RepID=UPI000812F15F|nr:NAD(P)-dependent oxidoreductase [Ensifer sp. LC163]OCP35839.1 UDP-glucose 4-epimerase [Ensifer sp. LC163]
MLILVTGATGKVGRNLIAGLLDQPRFSRALIRALCHNRLLDPSERLDVVCGTIADREVAEAAMKGVTHVVHLATCKETPDAVMDITVKGLFWLLEAFRTSSSARQFILVGGDAAVGHFFYRHDGPVTEKTPHRAYPGCYALSKVLEEVMLEQYAVQYGSNTCCLRAPWIMEKDDFKQTLSFGDDVFGAPDWKTFFAPAEARRYAEAGTVPLLRDADGRPLKRNFVHVGDLVSAILEAIDNPRAERQLFNISMDRPVDYGEVARYLARTRNLDSVDVPSAFHSNWMDNSKAKYLLDWRPDYDLEKLIDSAWQYERQPNDPRVVWYPG